MGTLLSRHHLQSLLQGGTLKEWHFDPHDNAIKTLFKFKNFGEAFSFMSAAALYCEKKDHHPEWRNVYNRLDVVLTTHDAGGVTQKDIDMALWMSRFFKGHY